MKEPNAAQEFKNAEDFAYRAKLMDEHGCPELSCLYERASRATALKAQILSEIEKKITHEVIPTEGLTLRIRGNSCVSFAVIPRRKSTTSSNC